MNIGSSGAVSTCAATKQQNRPVGGQRAARRKSKVGLRAPADCGVQCQRSLRVTATGSWITGPCGAPKTQRIRRDPGPNREVESWSGDNGDNPEPILRDPRLDIKVDVSRDANPLPRIGFIREEDSCLVSARIHRREKQQKWAIDVVGRAAKLGRFPGSTDVIDRLGGAALHHTKPRRAMRCLKPATARQGCTHIGTFVKSRARPWVRNAFAVCRISHPLIASRRYGRPCARCPNNVPNRRLCDSGSHSRKCLIRSATHEQLWCHQTMRRLQAFLRHLRLRL